MCKIIDCKSIAEKILFSIGEEVRTMASSPCLVSIIFGNDKASRIYVNNKHKTCEKCGILSKIIELSEETTESELLDLIGKLNNDKNVNGILVQLPLPSHINPDLVAKTISVVKDVDCFNPYNIGNYFLNPKKENLLAPCTVKGCEIILDSLNVDLAGKKAIVLGRSNIVGKPLIPMLLGKNCSVECLHSKSMNLQDELKTADVVISAIGKAKFLKKEFLKKNVLVVDVGINRLSDGTVCGDCDLEDVKDICSYITPVPNGVGRLTVACLLLNTLLCYKMQNKIEKF